MRKLCFITAPLITASILVTGCGGSSSEKNEQPSSLPELTQPSTTTLPSSNSIITTTDTLSLSGIKGIQQVLQQKVNGVVKPKKAIVDAQFSNATGHFIFNSTATQHTGNITFGVKVDEPNSITNISLYLPDVEISIPLCTTNCGQSFTKTLTGFNPQLSGVKEGNLRLELYVTDNENNTAIIDALSINWRPTPISSVNTIRDQDKLLISWQGESTLNRYNVYAATEPNLTPTNALSLENGVQRLAITTQEVELIDQSPNQNYYILITAINESGESGLSTPLKIPSTVITENLAPYAVTDEIEVSEDTTFSGNIVENDVDPENQTITVSSIVVQPTNGSLTWQSNGEISYSPNINFHGNDSFSYEIVDDESNTAQGSVSIIVDNVNDAPIASEDVFNLKIDKTLTLDQNALISNDFDIDGNLLFVNITPITSPLHGTLQLFSDGSLTYVADGTFSQSDSFEYQITDNNGGTSNALVTLLPSGKDTVPSAVNDLYTVNEDTTLNIASTASGILANDSDPNMLSFVLKNTLIETTSHGNLTLSNDGTFTYLPNSNFHGIDSFNYEIENTLGETAQAFVSITVTPVVDMPIINTDSYVTSEDTTLNIDVISGLLSNDVDIDNGTLTVNSAPVTSTSQGELTLNNDGSFTYIANENFNGVDTFTYQALNNNGGNNTALVTINVSSVNDTPQVINDTGVTLSDTELTINALANDIDIDGDTLTISSATTIPSHGSVAIVGNQLVYTPEITFGGVASIDYTIEDPAGLSSSGTVSINVSQVGSSNTAPTATNDSYTINEDITLNASSVIANDNDSDGGTLSIVTTPQSNVSNGILVLQSDGTFSYAPQENYNGTDSFIYTLFDGQGGFSTAQVDLTITSINDVPVATTDSYSTLENTPITVIASDFNALLSNDTDNDNDPLTVNVGASTSTSDGILSLDTDGEFTYTPNADFSGTDSFTYQVEDGNGGVNSGLANILVINVNAAPLAIPDNYNMLEGNVLNAASVLLNDTDQDDDTLSVDTSFVSLPSNGAVTFSTDGTFIYTPATGFFGADSFSYRVDDGNGEQDEGLIHITVVPDPSAHGNPSAMNDSYSLDEDTTLIESTLLNNDKSDLLNSDDTTELTVTTTPVSQPNNGNLILQNDGSFTYTPNENYSGDDSFSYEVSNIYDKTSTAIVMLTINAIDDAPIANDDSFTIEKNSGKYKAKFLLDNDSDPEGSHLDIDETPIINVSHGTLKLKKHGDIEYTPDTDFVGTDSFVYRLVDDADNSDLATVTITVVDDVDDVDYVD